MPVRTQCLNKKRALYILPLEGDMPKIEVNEDLFFTQLGKRLDYDALEKELTCAKAELDEKPDESVPSAERVIKIELNDTNRPDLWSLGGVARQLRLHSGAPHTDYSAFLSSEGNIKDCGERVVTVDERLKDIRPFMVSFVISGKAIDDPMLRDIIQTQEKLAWNYGRKRLSISMGIYRVADITFPVHYKAVDPDTTSFVPLQCTTPMTCRQILTDHPKGRDYGWIIADKKLFPLLTDDKGEVMSMAPVINSATLGAVQVGDKDLMVELTGSDIEQLLLSANIVACDFADAGYAILPVKVCHPYDTGLGRDITAPYFFQKPTSAALPHINALLGSQLDMDEAADALERMGNKVTVSGDSVTVLPPPYRNDFLHEVDIIEDVMIGRGVDTFESERPNDFTVGRLLPLTQVSRKIKGLMVGMGYQEMIFNYVGSRHDYIDNMGIDENVVIEIANPMSENYQFIRPEILSSLLRSESQSASAQYPHKVFEIGKVAYRCEEENTLTRTRAHLGFLVASSDASFNSAAADVSAILYFMGLEYKVQESSDPRFIPGRQAAVIVAGKAIGTFGEVSAQVLTNWAITVPCVAGEIDIEEIMAVQ